MPDTSSGRRAASTLAKLPPRLWPTIAARWPCVAHERLEPVLEPLDGRAGAVHVRRMPAREV